MISVKAPGVMDVTTWRQERSMTVHLVNLTNPMMMKGPFRELIPLDAEVQIRIPANTKVTAVNLLLRKQKVNQDVSNGILAVSIPKIEDHEIIGIDFG